jgi:hypothetical protein
VKKINSSKLNIKIDARHACTGRANCKIYIALPLFEREILVGLLL